MPPAVSDPPLFQKDDPIMLAQPYVYQSNLLIGSNLPTEMWASLGSHNNDAGLHFSCRDAADYPAYRHRFITYYNDLRHNLPDLFLRWVEKTIEGQAKRYIHIAFA